jgi:tetratricopeptide (TPR) repeat protein
LADAGHSNSVSVQLERILSRPPLLSSPSLSRFLRFIVEETLAGHSEEINEYNLGVRVFNRGAEFNPRTDPIVRVQTHHLRSRLAQYYANSGAADPVVIELRPRSYVPLFRVVQSSELSEAVALPAESPATPANAAPSVPAQSPAGKPQPGRITRGNIAAGAAVVLVAVAAIGLLGRAWQPAAVSAKHHEPDPTAQDLYIRGRYLLDRQMESALRQSIECFQQSTARDPQFAAAFAGIADAHNLLVQYGYMAPREGMEVARRAARHALELDPRLAEGYVSLAAISEAYDWNFKEAESQYRRAIQLNPQLPAAHLWYGMFLRDQGRLQEAMPELRRAEQLEPLSVLANINLAAAFRATGDSNSALEHAKRAAELNPDLPAVNLMLANIYYSRSDVSDANAMVAHAMNLAAGNPHALSMLACTYVRMGRRTESVAISHQLEELAKQRYVSPFDLGNVAWGLGDKDGAVTWYEEAYRQRSTGMLFLRNDKAGGAMDSPRLQSLIKKMG